VGSGAAVPNIRVSHDGFATHADPSLAVNPHNARNLLGAAQVIGSTSGIGTYTSSPRLITNRADSGATNPVIAAGPHGAVYVVYGIESNTQSATGPDTALKVISSTDSPVLERYPHRTSGDLHGGDRDRGRPVNFRAT
jgi:hypothetical protein